MISFKLWTAHQCALGALFDLISAGVDREAFWGGDARNLESPTRTTVNRWDMRRKRCSMFGIGGNGAATVQSGIGANTNKFDVVV